MPTYRSQGPSRVVCKPDPRAHHADRRTQAAGKNLRILERDPEVVCPTFPVPVGTGIFLAGGNAKFLSHATCTTWDPAENPDPPGCDWFVLPPDPARR